MPLQGIGTIPVPPTLGVSPSMNPAIGNVQANLSTIITTVQTAQPDAQFAVADYKDMGDSQPFTVDSNLTASAATAIAAANSITASGGGDIPEDQINALYQVGSGAIGFRPDSTRLVVWFGDAMGHDPSNGKTINDAITAPTVSCGPGVNPDGVTPPGYQNAGFYRLVAADNLPGVMVTVSDTKSSASFGPYAPDTTIKLTQALGAGPSAVPGEGAVNWKIMLKGDALLTATDAAGNTATATCKVPPKSK